MSNSADDASADDAARAAARAALDELDRELHAIPGVVKTGLFVGRCDLLIVADAAGVRRLARLDG